MIIEICICGHTYNEHCGILQGAHCLAHGPGYIPDCPCKNFVQAPLEVLVIKKIKDLIDTYEDACCKECGMPTAKATIEDIEEILEDYFVKGISKS